MQISVTTTSKRGSLFVFFVTYKFPISSTMVPSMRCPTGRSDLLHGLLQSFSYVEGLFDEVGRYPWVLPYLVELEVAYTQRCQLFSKAHKTGISLNETVQTARRGLTESTPPFQTGSSKSVLPVLESSPSNNLRD